MAEQVGSSRSSVSRGSIEGGERLKSLAERDFSRLDLLTAPVACVSVGQPLKEVVLLEAGTGNT